MKTKHLIGKGYFPEDITPPFKSKKLGNHSISLFNHFERMSKDIKKQYNVTECLPFSVPKTGLRRRIFEIPNPIYQIQLSKIIEDNWENIIGVYRSSKCTNSMPIPDKSKKRAIKPKFSISEMHEKNMEDSFNKPFLLKTDISKFFPSIYTHSITWALHSKKEGKNKRFDNSLAGNKIDKAIQNCRNGQTNGIPTGPDTSRIISEIISCDTDKKLADKHPGIVGNRFMDDCYFYFSSYSEAEEFVSNYRVILNDYGLMLNEDKTDILEFPYQHEPSWVPQLRNYKIRSKIKEQNIDLKTFFSLVINLRIENPKDSIFKYAARKLSNMDICKQNWKLYQSILFKIGLYEPITLPIILKPFLRYNKLLDKIKTKKFIHTLIQEHLPKVHNFEVAWALWFAYVFSININKNIAQDILNSRDHISIIMALDLKEKGLISSEVNVSKIESTLNEDSLINDQWLLTYESVKKGWLDPVDPNLLENSAYFSELEKKDIEFYSSIKDIELEDEIMEDWFAYYELRH